MTMLWWGYGIYFYDEENGRNYVMEFIESLASKDEETAVEILQLFFERIESGMGIPEEWMKGKNPKIKKLKGTDIWEYRTKSKKLKKLIRIYFGVDENGKS